MKGDKGPVISRKKFILLLLSPFFLAGFGKRTRPGPRQAKLIRPPAALAEDEFLDRCIRCGNCMKVCVTNGLQPVIYEAGLEGIWTPQLVPEIGYCEYRCTLCGNTCPTGAIRSLTQAEKEKTRLGTAKIDRALCIAWAEKKECIVCEEHCPVYGKAIKLESSGEGPSKPYIDADLCVGCGICQNKCPTRPVRAVKIYPIGNPSL